MPTLSLIGLTWCHLGASLANLFCCSSVVPQQSLILFLTGEEGRELLLYPFITYTCSSSAAAFTVNRNCTKQGNNWIIWGITAWPPLFAMKRQNLPWNVPQSHMYIITNQYVTVSALFFIWILWDPLLPKAQVLCMSVFMPLPGRGQPPVACVRAWMWFTGRKLFYCLPLSFSVSPS